MKRKARKTKNLHRLKNSIVVSDCTTITELQNRCKNAALIVDAILLDFIETAYHNPMYKDQLRELHNAVADTPVLLRGLIAYFDREEGLLKPSLETINEDTTITETNE